MFDDGIIPDSEHPHSPQQFRLAGEDRPHNLEQNHLFFGASFRENALQT